MRKKNILCYLITTAALLSIPLLFRWPWTGGDFLFGFVVIFGASLVYEFLATRTHDKKKRVAIGILVFLGLVFVWVNAVNDFDLLEEFVLKIMN